MIPQLGDNIKSNRRDGSADSIIPCLATLRSAQDGLVIKGQKRDEKAESREPDTAIPSSRWLRLTLSEAVVEASLRLRSGQAIQNRPTLVKRVEATR